MTTQIKNISINKKDLVIIYKDNKPINEWIPAYFYSGGTTDNNNQYYIKDQIGIITPTENPKRNGADPSCGGNDFSTLSTCILNIPLNADRQPPNTGTFEVDNTRKKYNYPVQNLEWSKSSINILMNHNKVIAATDSNNKLMCKNCPNSGDDCNAHVQLINPDYDGKVPCLAHGTFGVQLSAATCTPDTYCNTLNNDLFLKRVQKLSAILSNGDYPKKDTSYITYYKAKNENWCCLITKKAFEDAGISHIYPEEANNGGVVISWGHGVKNGACGSVSFLKQGKFNFGVDNSSTENNVVLLLQIGMRAWSGEWSDSIGTQQPPFNNSNPFDETLPNSNQSYITEGLPFNSSSATCLQPLMKDIDSTDGGDLDKLLNTICNILPLNKYGHNPCNIPQQNGTCSCDPSSGNTCQPAVCERANNKSIELCESYKPFGCGKWTPDN